MIRETLARVVMTLAGVEISIGQVLALIVTLLLIIVIGRGLLQKLRVYEDQHGWPTSVRRRNNQRLLAAVILSGVGVLLMITGADPIITTVRTHDISISSMLMMLATLLIVLIADNFISQRIEEEMMAKVTATPLTKDGSVSSRPTVNYIMISTFIYLLLLRFKELDPRYLLRIKDETPVYISLSDVVLALAIILVARLLVWLFTHIFLDGVYRRNKIDVGRQFAFNRLLTYIIYFVGTLLALQNMGINMTMLWTGAAALLVGVGIALQQTISDFFSGIVLLFERSLEVGDYVQVEETYGILTRIGARSSTISNQENKTYILPNSKLVNNNVINWTRESKKTRHSIKVGVAYGSDTQLVKTLLLQSLDSIDHIIHIPQPFVRFQSFGDSSLDFELFFFSEYTWNIDDVRSEIRLEIDRLFREHKIAIPFPQRDIWLRSAD